ncbi:MAG: ABC-2 transporter permease [Eubacteriales bacterium]|nr:ABC-2 transporter permease [Eubacteriales bacterium]
MKNLLIKEFKLALNPGTYFYLACSAMLLIPSYPYFVAFIYTFIGFITVFILNRENKDILFTASLPIRKRDTVKARISTIAIIELMQIATAVPFAVIRGLINPEGNAGGIDANPALFGFVFVMYALFNTIYFPMFYKTAYKVAWPLIISCSAVTVYIFAVEIAVQSVPVLKTYLDTLDAGYAVTQLLVLIAGIAVFVLSAVFAFKKAAKRFEKVDL